jgi:hypothetical protein
LNLIKESSSEAPAVVQEPITSQETTDDDAPIISPEENKTEEPPSATVPATATTPVGNPEDRGALIETAREQLRMARAASLSFGGVISPGTLSQVRRPDRVITLEILRAFRDGADFETWVQDTVTRRLGQKAKDSRWGLYLADAKNHAEDSALQREADAKRQIDAEIARERQQAAEAAALAELDQPMPWLQAFGRIQYRVSSAGRDIPLPLKARLRRTGELIAPNELERQIFGWQSCHECDDEGTVGNAIDRTLDFCCCPAGTEAQQLPTESELAKPEEGRFHKGTDYPNREIGRVHADAKSLLVAACHAGYCPFTADAVEDSEVTDDSQTLKIHLSGRQFGIVEGDIRRAAERLGWQRRIAITGGKHAKQPDPAQAAKPEASAPSRATITQADIDRTVEENRRQRQSPTRMEPARAGGDFGELCAVGDVQ